MTIPIPGKEDALHQEQKALTSSKKTSTSSKKASRCGLSLVSLEYSEMPLFECVFLLQ